MIVMLVVTIVSITFLAIGLYGLKTKKISKPEFQKETISSKVSSGTKTALTIIQCGIGLIVIGGLLVLYTLFVSSTSTTSTKNPDAFNAYQEVYISNAVNKKQYFLISSVILLISGSIMLTIGNRIFLNAENLPQSLITKNEESIKVLQEEEILLDL